MPNKPQLAVQFGCSRAVGKQESFCCAPGWRGLPRSLPKARFLVGWNNSTSLLRRPLSLWTATLTATDVNELGDLISERCIPRNMRLIVPQCLQRGFLRAATVEVARPFSSPCLPIWGSVRGPQHCLASPSELSCHLSVTTMTKRDCRWAIIKTCINFTSGCIP